MVSELGGRRTEATRQAKRTRIHDFGATRTARIKSPLMIAANISTIPAAIAAMGRKGKYSKVRQPFGSSSGPVLRMI